MDEKLPFEALGHVVFERDGGDFGGHMLLAFARSAAGAERIAAALNRSSYPPDETPPSSDTRLILAAIQELKPLMSKTSDALNDLKSADDELAGEVDQLVTAVEAFPGQQAQAVADALTAAGVDDDANAAAVAAATAGAQAMADKIKAVLSPTPPSSADGAGGPADPNAPAADQAQA